MMLLRVRARRYQAQAASLPFAEYLIARGASKLHPAPIPSDWMRCLSTVMAWIRSANGGSRRNSALNAATLRFCEARKPVFVRVPFRYYAQSGSVVHRFLRTQ
jgi:hypothetical protein